MAEKHRKISTTIFLLAVFVFLAVFLGGWLYRVYIEQTTYSTGESQSALYCTEYYFDIEGLAYDQGQLSFEIVLKRGMFDVMVVESGTEMRDINTSNMVTGSIISVEIEIPLADEIVFYPKGCKTHNSKSFNIK